MADTKTSAENAASTLDGSELVRGVQSAANVKIATAQLKTHAIATPTNHGVVIGTATGLSYLAAAAAGTLLSGVAASDPAFTATPTLGVVSTTTGQLKLANAGSVHLTTLQAGVAAAARTWTLPTNFGAAGSVMTDVAGDGVLSMVATLDAGSTKLDAFAATTSAELKTVISDETGSGALVFGTAPTIAGGTHTALTSLGIRSTGAAFDLTIATAEVLTAGRTLSIVLGDAARTITLGGALTTAGALITSGANSLTLTTTGATNVTLPTAGTLAILGANTFSGIQTLPAGSTSSISLVFGALTNYGFFGKSSDATNCVTFSGGGTETLRFQQAQLGFVSNALITWGNQVNTFTSNTDDTGLKRAAPGVVGLTNASSAGGTFAAVALSPAQITANQNNYNPGGRSYFQRWSTDASRDITGLTFTVTQVAGQTHMIVNAGAQDVVLKHQTISTAANQFYNSTAADITLTANQAALVVYDATSSYWRVFKMN